MPNDRLHTEYPQHAVLVAHGQPSDPMPAEEALADLARSVQAEMPGWVVTSATLALEGRLEAVCDAAGPGTVIYPGFMSGGWFASSVLPRRLEGRNVFMATPLGLDPDLPPLMAEVLVERAKTCGWALEDTELLLLAHGSGRGTKAAEAVTAFSHALHDHISLKRHVLGYVEQPPYVAQAARQVGPQSICLPFFVQEGDHVKNDIAEALNETRFAGHFLPVIAKIPGVPALIARAIRASA